MKRLMMAALAAGTAFSALFVVAGATVPAAAAPSSGCPANKLGSIPTATNVAADFSNSGTAPLPITTTYNFYSLTDQNPSGGVPGLVKYCVYPTPTSQPTAITVDAKGANGAKWLSAKGSNNFAFVRPGGDKTNIPLDGDTTEMGTATWSTAPDKQDIVLHINDPATCASLYGPGTSLTCFVKPSAPSAPPCTTGDANVAYNAMPFDVVNCRAAGVAFQANGWNEFGDSVTLAPGTGRTLASLIVDFQSFACATGTWNHEIGTDPCGGGATPGVSPGSFTWPITANIYAVDANGLPTGSPLATTTGPMEIPFRPNADPTLCSSEPTKWFNPLAPGGGACQNSIGTLLTFNLTAPNPLPDQVAWTVAFNTFDKGYSPAGNVTPPCTLLVCPQNPADSLNVGDQSFPSAPYAGTSLFDTGVPAGFAVGSKGQPASPPPVGTLSFITPDDNGRPLGEIITTP